MPAIAIIPILLYVFSMILGFAVFYIISDLVKEQKKKQAGEALSQIINFVLFIWLSKILLNLPLLLRDPLAALAYPSGSQAFYLAILFSAALLFFSARSGRIQCWQLIQTLLYILLPAAFFYEFAQLAWFDDAYAFGNLILYAVLVALFLGLNDRVSPYAVGSVLLSMWAGGVLLISSLQSYSSAFGYVMEPWFIFILFTAGHFLILLSSRRRATNECY
ncbi:hypothetical protein [Planococcus sp. ISL-109]|uniref:hypothetical protein n=1 Tax=Planococcus sp. ISL-109 TaxID=2819166 RepID=UPI001BE7483A|nr:hypothetical protein [Planococcus sp. ISL-109]MBT2582859.1 hypothetical protein [Planococcus sp. ISL-109]